MSLHVKFCREIAGNLDFRFFVHKHIFLCSFFFFPRKLPKFYEDIKYISYLLKFCLRSRNEFQNSNVGGKYSLRINFPPKLDDAY